MRSLLPALGLLLAVAPALAQDTPEPPKTGRAPAELLPASSLFYFQFDGLAGHRPAYNKTVLAQLMKEDLGEFFKQCIKSFETLIDMQIQGFEQIQEIKGQAGQDSDDDNAHGQQAPRKLVASDVAELQGYRKLVKCLDHFASDGLVVGAAVTNAGDYQITLILPNGATKKNWGNTQQFCKRCLMSSDVKVTKVRGRIVHQDQWTGLRWWKEGDHVICVYGRRPMKVVLEVIDGMAPNLTASPLYKNVSAFDEYKSCCRGFVDVKQVVDLFANTSESDNALARGMEAMMRKLVLGQVGVTGVHSLTWSCGFEGKYCRSTMKLNIVPPEQRQGLLKLISAPVEFDASKLPPLPDDADWVSVHHVDWQRIFDTVNQFYQVSQLGDWLSVGGPLAGKMPSLNKQLEEVLGLDLREELLGALDSTVVLSEAYSEGPWILGNTCAIKVKDEAKLQAALEKLVTRLRNSVKEASNVAVEIKQTPYLGGTVQTVYTGPIPAPFFPSYAIHDGWLIVGVHPRNVRSYLWRARHPAHAWKVPALAHQAIQAGLAAGNAETKLAAVTVIDPRRTLETVLPLASFLPYMTAPLDLGGFPHTKAITSKLSPNVTAFFDDGDAWRWETWATLDIPSGSEIAILYGLLAGFGSISDGRPFSFQTWTPQAGMTLPAPQYLQHPPQYIPPSPEFPLAKETEELNKAIQAHTTEPVLPDPAPGFIATAGASLPAPTAPVPSLDPVYGTAAGFMPGGPLSPGPGGSWTNPGQYMPVRPAISTTNGTAPLSPTSWSPGSTATEPKLIATLPAGNTAPAPVAPSTDHLPLFGSTVDISDLLQGAASQPGKELSLDQIKALVEKVCGPEAHNVRIKYPGRPHKYVEVIFDIPTADLLPTMNDRIRICRELTGLDLRISIRVTG